MPPPAQPQRLYSVSKCPSMVSTPALCRIGADEPAGFAQAAGVLPGVCRGLRRPAHAPRRARGDPERGRAVRPAEPRGAGARALAGGSFFSIEVRFSERLRKTSSPAARFPFIAPPHPLPPVLPARDGARSLPLCAAVFRGVSNAGSQHKLLAL